MKQDKRVAMGFSLTELLVVIVVIIVLAGLTIQALPGIQSRINRGKVETFLAEIENGLDRYEVDWGNYPVNEPSGTGLQTRDEEGMNGSMILYKHLSGDFDEDGKVDEEGEIYVNKLVFNEESKDKRSIQSITGTGYMVVDSFNSPLRYLAHKPNSQDKKTMNPTYDLWSIVDTNPARASDETMQARYITNWQRR